MRERLYSSDGVRTSYSGGSVLSDLGTAPAVVFATNRTQVVVATVYSGLILLSLHWADVARRRLCQYGNHRLS